MKPKKKEKALDDLAREGEALLFATLENKIEQGFLQSFATLEEAVDSRKLLQSRLERLAAIEALPPTLKGKIHEAKAILADCKEESFKNFEALTLLPLEKETRLAEESYERVKKRYLPLRDAYVALCEVREVPPMETECTEDGIAILEKAIEQLEGIIRCDDEEGYIAECLDQVMEEMGYHVVGERHQQKRSGKRFRHELYTYKDGMVVDVTTADDGKITMELGATDTVDRLPTRSEEKELCHSMEEFCVDFVEIEKRLAEMGIEVKERISHLPPTVDYAQIINLTDYEMKEALPEQKKKAASESEVLRRRQRKRKLLRRAL